MDDIIQRIQENLAKVTEKEKDVLLQEERVAEEARQIDSQVKALEEAKTKFEKSLASFEAEKLAMSGGPVEGDAIVHLNVQGEFISTRRDTLTQFPESRLAYMFNGQWDSKILKDEEGRIFLDVQPSLFRKLLNFLTTRHLAENNDQVPVPQLCYHDLIHFKTMLQYFGVEQAVYPNLGCFSDILKSRCIVLSDDAATATNISEGTAFVLGEDLYRKEIVKFVLSIESLANPWMFLGVLSCSDIGHLDVDDNSFNMNSNAFGWADKGGLWIAGQRVKDSDCVIPPGVLKQGLTVEMVLDCASSENKLTLKLKDTDYEAQIITLPSGHAWRLHINLVSLKDAVRLVKTEHCE